MLEGLGRTQQDLLHALLHQPAGMSIDDKINLSIKICFYWSANRFPISGFLRTGPNRQQKSHEVTPVALDHDKAADYSAMSFSGLLSTGWPAAPPKSTLASITGGFSSCSTSAV